MGDSPAFSFSWARYGRAMRTTALLLPFAFLALAACGPADSDPGPGGVTVSEAKALDEAAAMLDERREAAEAGKAEAVATPSEGEEE